VPITVVTGVHDDWYELFAHGGIRGIVDLKGKSVGLVGGSELCAIAALAS
jgi:hypothetical protein